MCGRYGRRADKQRIAEWMQIHNTNVFDDSYLAPSYNVAPQTVQHFIDQLDDALLLDNRRFAEAQREAVTQYRAAARREPCSAEVVMRQIHARGKTVR